MATPKYPLRAMKKDELLAHISEIESELRREKQSLTREIDTLKAKLAQLEAVNKTLSTGPAIEYFGRKFVPVALTDEQVKSIWGTVYDIALRGFGSGEYVSGCYETGGVYRDSLLDATDILPGYDGFVIQGYGHTDTGFSMDKIWGLKIVPMPCGECKKLTTRKYRCQECEAKMDAEYHAATSIEPLES